MQVFHLLYSMLYTENLGLHDCVWFLQIRSQLFTASMNLIKYFCGLLLLWLSAIFSVLIMATSKEFIALCQLVLNFI